MLLLFIACLLFIIVSSIFSSVKMSSFTDSALEKKLSELNGSQQSIQTLSLWLIHHRKHHKTIVQVWFRELKKSKIFKFSFDIYFAFHSQYMISNFNAKCSGLHNLSEDYDHSMENKSGIWKAHCISHIKISSKYHLKKNIYI